MPDDPLAAHEPFWSAGSVQLLELVLVTVGERTTVWREEEWEAFLAKVKEHNAEARARWRQKQLGVPQCKKCDCLEHRCQWQTAKDGSRRIRAECAGCKSFLMWAPQVEPFLSAAGKM